MVKIAIKPREIGCFQLINANCGAEPDSVENKSD